MKRSIFIAAAIYILVAGWIGSGQFTNVKAQDEETAINNEDSNNDSKEIKYLLFKVFFIEADQGNDLQLIHGLPKRSYHQTLGKNSQQ